MKKSTGQTHIISIKIDNVTVDERYYSFDWLCHFKGNKTYKGRYEDSYEGHTARGMKKILDKGYALEIALEKLADEIGA